MATPLQPPSDNGSDRPEGIDLDYVETLIDAEQQEQAP
jgi:hypothetical protein